MSETAETLAAEWLRRQRLGHDTPFNGEGPLDGEECRTCGTADGEPHEPTDPCGIVEALLTSLVALRAECGVMRAGLEVIADFDPSSSSGRMAKKTLFVAASPSPATGEPTREIP